MNANTVEELKIEQVPINQLQPDPTNPRSIPPDQLNALTRSLQQFGMVSPIIARRSDFVIIGGHQRWLAARRLGLAIVQPLRFAPDSSTASCTR